ncbi:MAG: hypothetical protein H6Q67_1955 [Firmicutes bacterium]|nr:hypothetical protein [Bacillota bacterium]
MPNNYDDIESIVVIDQGSEASLGQIIASVSTATEQANLAQNHAESAADSVTKAKEVLSTMESTIEEATTTATTNAVSEATAAAALSVINAANYANNSATYADNAAISETNAKTSETKAATSETNAGTYAASAAARAKEVESSLTYYVPKSGADMAGPINESYTEIASASTTDLSSTNNTVIITGTKTITFFGTLQQGAKRTLIFSSSLSITYNADTMILPGNRDLYVAAGGIVECFSLESGAWRCFYHPPRNEINVRDYGATGDGATDDSSAFASAIQFAFACSTVTSGWRMPLKIKVPNGTYIVSESLISSTTSVPYGRFLFEGDGWQSTKIMLTVSDSTALFDNQDIFGFTIFTGIYFGVSTAGTGTFMNMSGANPQSLIFEKCVFKNWLKIIVVSGSADCSEVTFRDCKLWEGTSDSIFFTLDNSQCVNWRFFATDIESFTGVVFQYLRGANIHMYQGSVISTSGGTFISVPSTAEQDYFGNDNGPHFSEDGVSFEMKGSSRLIDIEQANVYFTANFSNSDVGGGELTTTSWYPILTQGKGMFTFNSCVGFDNFKCYHTTIDGDYTSPLKLTFNDCSIPNDIINNSVVSSLTHAGCAPIYTFNNCITVTINGSIRLGGSYFNAYKYTRPITKHIISLSPEQAYFAYVSPTATTTKTYDLPLVNLMSLSFINLASTSTSQTFTITIYDTDSTKTLLTGTINTKTNSTLSDSLSGIPYYFPQDGQLVIKIVPSSVTYTSSFYIGGYLVLEY